MIHEAQPFEPESREKRRLPQRIPRRAELLCATVKLIRAEKPYQADIRIVDLGEGPMVVKDFAAKCWWLRWLGRALIAHEYRAYRRLGGLPGIPVLLGRVDPYALALERVRGIHLTCAPNRYRDGRDHLARFHQVIDRFRARRFFHLDLRGRRNVLVRDDGEIVVLDLAASLWFRRRSWTYRLFGGWLAWYYDTVTLKWKMLLTPSDLTERDRLLLSRSQILRALWIFNPKGSWRKEVAGALRHEATGTNVDLKPCEPKGT